MVSPDDTSLTISGTQKNIFCAFHPSTNNVDELSPDRPAGSICNKNFCVKPEAGLGFSMWKDALENRTAVKLDTFQVAFVKTAKAITKNGTKGTTLALGRAHP